MFVCFVCVVLCVVGWVCVVVIVCVCLNVFVYVACDFVARCCMFWVLLTVCLMFVCF